MPSMNVGGGLAGIVFVYPVCSVVPLTLTESSEWQWVRGATLPLELAAEEAPSFEAMKLGDSQLRSGRNCPPSIVSPFGPTGIPAACSAAAIFGPTSVLYTTSEAR